MTVTSFVLVVVAVGVLGARLRPLPVRRPVARDDRWAAPDVSAMTWRRRRAGPTDADVSAWCSRVARSARAGSSLTQAIADADDESPADRRPFPDVAHSLARGRTVADALATVDADPASAAGLVAPVLRACADVGGPAAPPLERVAAVLLARAAERDERLAGTAQARLSARVLTTVPFGVVALLAVTEPAIRTVLATPAGAACLGAGIALNVLGRWWMSVIIGGSS